MSSWTVAALVGVLVGLGGIGCTSNPPPASGERLLGEFKSFDDVASVARMLDSKGVAWQMIPGKPWPEDDDRPRARTDVIDVPQFSGCAGIGWLRLEFFNDRLMRTTIFPWDPDAYLAQIERCENLNLSLGETARRGPNVVGIVGRTAAGQGYVEVGDERLLGEKRQWIRRYASSRHLGLGLCGATSLAGPTVVWSASSDQC